MEQIEAYRHLSTSEQLLVYLGLTPLQALAAVISTCALYGFFIVMTRLMGQRMLMKLTGFDMLLVIVLGAVMGRAMMGYTPTFGTAVIVLVVLTVLELAFGRLSGRPRLSRMINNRAVCLVAGGRFVTHEMKRAHITRTEVLSELRKKGVHSLDEVAAVILERTGDMSVLRAGTPIDPQMIVGVRSAGEIPHGLLLQRK